MRALYCRLSSSADGTIPLNITVCRSYNFTLASKPPKSAVTLRSVLNGRLLSMQKRNIEDSAITAKLIGCTLTNRITERVNRMPGFLGTHLALQL